MKTKDLAGYESGLAFGALQTPIGLLTFACTSAGVVAAALPNRDLAGLKRSAASGEGDGEPGGHGKLAQDMLERSVAELAAYFAGKLRTFTVPLSPQGTAFQRTVWDAVCAVPFGETTTYGAIAAGLGKPRSARAVGYANGANPIPIIIPCHRLVGHDGSLTGYAGGLEMKRSLIEHERRFLESL